MTDRREFLLQGANALGVAPMLASPSWSSSRIGRTTRLSAWIRSRETSGSGPTSAVLIR